MKKIHLLLSNYCVLSDGLQTFWPKARFLISAVYGTHFISDVTQSLTPYINELIFPSDSCTNT